DCRFVSAILPCADIRFHVVMLLLPPRYTLFPYTTLFRSSNSKVPPGAPTRRTRVVALSTSVISASSVVVTVTVSRSAVESPARRSEEHTSELQSRENLVCRLLLEKKNKYLLRRVLKIINA